MTLQVSTIYAISHEFIILHLQLVRVTAIFCGEQIKMIILVQTYSIVSSQRNAEQVHGII